MFVPGGAPWVDAAAHGFDWQGRMRAEMTAMHMQRLLKQGRLVFPKKENISEGPYSSRYVPSPSAQAARRAKECRCFPPRRWVDAPTRLAAPPVLDELSVLVAQRRYASYTDYLHNERYPSTVPVVPFR